MKKFLSLMLAVTMLLSMMTAVSVSAEVSTTTIDFTDGTIPSSCTVSNPSGFENDGTISLKTDATDITVGNYAQLAWANATAKYPTYYFNSDTITMMSGDKLEVEFDIKLTEFSSRKLQLRFISDSYYTLNFETSGKIKRVAHSNSNVVADVGEMPNGWVHSNFANWTRLKFIFEYAQFKNESTSETPHNGKKLVGLYVNGQAATLVDDSDIASENGRIWCALKGDGTYQEKDEVKYKSLAYGDQMNTSRILDFDNISISKYTSTDTAPVEKGALVAAIRSAQSEYTEAVTNYGAESEYATALKAEIESAWALYGSTTEQTAIDDAAASLAEWSANDYTTSVIWDDTDDSNPKATTAYIDAEGSPTKARNTEKFAGDITTDNVLQISKSTKNYPRVAAQLGANDRIAVDAAAAAKHGRNAFAEFEYDLNISELKKDLSDGKNVDFATYLVDAVNPSVRCFSVIIYQNGDVAFNYLDNKNATAETEKVRDVFDHSKTNRFRIVVQLTDVNGEPVQKAVGVYLNGVNLISEPVSFMNLNTSAVVTAPDVINRLAFYPSSMEFTSGSYYIDNVKISTYNKANAADASPNADNGKLVSALRTKYAEAAKVTANPEKYASVADAVTASKTALEEKYNGGDDDLETLLSAADSVTAQIAAIDAQPEIISITQADGKITGVVLAKNDDYNYDGTVLVGLYSGTTVKELVGAAVADNVFVEQATGKITVTFDAPITIPTGENLSVKAMLWNDLDNADGIDVLEESI